MPRRACRPTTTRLPLIRGDGETLVRFSSARDFAAFQEIVGSGLLTDRARSNVDGLPRLYAFENIPRFPVYIMYAIDENAIQGAWFANHRVYGVLIERSP
jgi:hypothetical protein